MSLLTNLKLCLQKLIDEHHALVSLAQEKKDILIKGNAQELVAMTNKENVHVQMIQKLEMLRQQLIEQSLLEKGVQSSGLSMQEWIQTLSDADDRGYFQRQREQLIEQITQLKAANQLNQQLLKQSMDFVRHTLELLTEDTDMGYTYQRPNLQGASLRSRSFYERKI